MMAERREILAASLGAASGATPERPVVRGLRDPGARAATFTTDAWLPVPPAIVIALVREADLGPLAGELRLWDARVLDGEPWSQHIVYVSALPWPMRDRAFAIENRVTLVEGGARLDSASVAPDAAERARVGGARWGKVVYSGYLVTSERGGARLRRVIEIDLDLPLPASVERAVLEKVYADNHAWLARGVEHARAPAIAARIGDDPMYAAIEAHTQATP